MRIIGGSHKGKEIAADNKLKLRPTTDFAKEGLFNILSNRCDLELFEVLDLFAGTGSISYEFVSRGCKTVHSVEIDARHVAYIRNTAKKFGFDNMRVIRNDAFKFLNICKMQYDIVFADPPYEMQNIEKIPQLVFERGILKKNGILIVEHSKRNDFSLFENFLENRRYGNVCFSFLGIH